MGTNSHVVCHWRKRDQNKKSGEPSLGTIRSVEHPTISIMFDDGTYQTGIPLDWIVEPFRPKFALSFSTPGFHKTTLTVTNGFAPRGFPRSHSGTWSTITLANRAHMEKVLYGLSFEWKFSGKPAHEPVEGYRIELKRVMKSVYHSGYRNDNWSGQQFESGFKQVPK